MQKKEKARIVVAVGKAIANQRKLAGLTQSQIAEALKIEKETVSRLETGVIAPTLIRLSELSEAIGCPIGHFFWFKEGSPQTQAETITEMLNTLPAERRESVVRCVAEMVKALRQ